MTTCSVDGCERQAHRRGWCNIHYRRWLRHGDPLTLRKTSNGELGAFFDANVVIETDDCIMWPYATSGGGYGVLARDGRQVKAHVVACTMAHGPKPFEGAQVRHVVCGNGHLGCFNPRHLAWGTQQDNADDMVRDGNSMRGERHHHHRLVEGDVSAIRLCLDYGFTQRFIAGFFGVDRGTVAKINNGSRWAWLD